MESTVGRFDYRSELDRRVRQFAHYLKLMRGRAHDEVRGNCFIIFDERRPDASCGGNELIEPKKIVLQVAGQDSLNGGISAGFDDIVPFDLPDDGWKEDESQHRFIQFAFEPDWFCVDLPRSTLFRPEAEKILRCRLGFFYLRDRKQFIRHDQDVGNHDPFRKVYIYGDEETAAEDMAFILFQVWNFPVDSCFFVTASAFSGKKDWEQGFPIQ